MKVYVIKNPQGEYMTETRDFINSIWQATLFNDYECALAYTPTDCKVCECMFIEKESFTDYTKQVRKEVCEEIKEKLRKQYPNVYANIGESLFCSDCYLRIRELSEILDQIQGE